MIMKRNSSQVMAAKMKSDMFCRNPFLNLNKIEAGREIIQRKRLGAGHVWRNLKRNREVLEAKTKSLNKISLFQMRGEWI